MKNTNALGGMPVVCDGVRLGRVFSVQLTPDLTKMAGLHVDCGLRGRRYIPAERVRVLGEVAVLVDGGPSGARPAEQTLPRRALTPEGARLGAITGAWIDEETRAVESLELSRGYWEDLFLGRVRVRSYHVQKDGGEVVCPGEGGEKT